jgi:hypothetical protein
VLLNRTIKTKSGDFWTKEVGVFTEALEMNFKVVIKRSAVAGQSDQNSFRFIL